MSRCDQNKPRSRSRIVSISPEADRSLSALFDDVVVIGPSACPRVLEFWYCGDKTGNSLYKDCNKTDGVSAPSKEKTVVASSRGEVCAPK